MPKPSGPTSEEIRIAYRALKKAGRENQARVWLAVADKISSPRRRVEVNLGKIERLASEGDFVVVPGKVLAFGDLTKSITVAALKFSVSARKKIERVGGRAISLVEAVGENPKGTGVRIVV